MPIDGRWTLVFQDVDWQDDAACAGLDTEEFFRGKGRPPKKVLDICAGCPVRIECAEYALANNEEFGVWGGLSISQRQAIKRGRRAA